MPIGYFNLTGVEFIAAGLLFAWLLVFSRAIDAYALGDVQTTDASSPADSDVTTSESGRAEQAAPTSSPSP